MELTKLLTAGFSLVFVLCLIGLVAVLLRRYGANMRYSAGKTNHLKIKEVANIDARKKVVLIEKDDKEYLVAFSDNAIEVLEAGTKELKN